MRKLFTSVILSLILTNIAFCHLNFLVEENNNEQFVEQIKESIDVVENNISNTDNTVNGPFDTYIDVYSMVFSSKKYVSGKEMKDFFFAVPHSFYCKATINKEKNAITINFPNYKQDLGNFKFVKEGLIASKSSLFNDIFSFPEDYSSVTLNLNLKDTKYEFSLLHVYKNKDFKDVQIKLTIPTESRIPRALYITFDFYQKVVSEKDYSTFVDYLLSLEPKKNDVK